jgi:hypothetical protein
MDWFWEHAEKIGNLAQVMTMFIALIALIFAYGQISSNIGLQREATAKDIYRDYLKLAFKHPQLAAPTRNLSNNDKYVWFVAFMLNSLEEIIASGVSGWEDTIREELRYHTIYLGSDKFINEDKGWDLYSEKLENLGREVVNENQINHA